MAWTDPRAVFFSPHPDDEVLCFGPAIANHVAAGRNVHVVLVTGGGASGVRGTLNGAASAAAWWGVTHDPAREGYAPLDVAAFKTARRNEFRASCGALGVPVATNLHLYDLSDGGVTSDQVKEIIRSDFAWPGASFKTASYRWGDHPDHLACGQALRELHQERPDIWGDCRWYVFPRSYWPTAEPDASTSFESPASATERQRVLNACRAYSGWAPALGHFAVGYQSTSIHFVPLEGDVRAMVQNS